MTMATLNQPNASAPTFDLSPTGQPERIVDLTKAGAASLREAAQQEQSSRLLSPGTVQFLESLIGQTNLGDRALQIEGIDGQNKKFTLEGRVEYGHGRASFTSTGYHEDPSVTPLNGFANGNYEIKNVRTHEACEVEVPNPNAGKLIGRYSTVPEPATMVRTHIGLMERFNADLQLQTSNPWAKLSGLKDQYVRVGYERKEEGEVNEVSGKVLSVKIEGSNFIAEIENPATPGKTQTLRSKYLDITKLERVGYPASFNQRHPDIDQVYGGSELAMLKDRFSVGMPVEISTTSGKSLQGRFQTAFYNNELGDVVLVKTDNGQFVGVNARLITDMKSTGFVSEVFAKPVRREDSGTSVAIGGYSSGPEPAKPAAVLNTLYCKASA